MTIFQNQVLKKKTTTKLSYELIDFQTKYTELNGNHKKTQSRKVLGKMGRGRGKPGNSQVNQVINMWYPGQPLKP